MTLKQIKELNIFLIIFYITTLSIFLTINGAAFAREVKYALLLGTPLGSTAWMNWQ